VASAWSVLGIDDSLTIRKLLEMVFTRAGYTFELASAGEEGITRAKRNPPHLILLDYVLPDMKGLDVANALAQDERTKGVPIVLMSAKSDDLRPLFKHLPSVIEFVSKPFTPPEISFLVADLLEKKARAAGKADKAEKPEEVPAEPSLFSHAQKEAGARALFTRLRDRFAQIPEWYRALGEGSPAPYFAKKILTPELMDGLLTALTPTFREVLGQAPAAKATPDAEDAALLQGQTSLLPLKSLLKELGACGRTGMLVLQGDERRTMLYLRRGDVIFATHNQPEDYVRQSQADNSAITPKESEDAAAEQRQTGKPVFVTHASSGKIPASDLPNLLYHQGKRVLLEAMDAGPCPFQWHDLAVLPSYVDAYGRSYAMDQLSLERLRLVDDWAQIELHVNSLDLVFRRGEGFSQNLRRFELTDNERRVLTLVDGRNTVRHIIERSSLATFEVFHVLFRMGQVGLVRRAEPGGTAGVAREGRTVMMLETDVEGVQEPLATLLKRRRQPIPLVPVAAVELLPALLRERPRLLLVNVGAPGVDAPAIAKDVRSHLEISDLPLLAVLDSEGAGRPDELLAAGFDGVLVKPFPFGELEKFLVA
jgi:CheY-like chemotaxis protein